VLQVWDAYTGKAVTLLKGHDDTVRACHFIGNTGKKVPSSRPVKRVCSLCAPDRVMSNVLDICPWCLHFQGPFSFALVQVLSGSDDGYARLWDRESGACLETLDNNGEPVRAVQPFAFH
jgi:WD40 repeat protein